jgi:hypothetical protein
MTGNEPPEKRQYKSPSKQWDIFLSHASEDKPYARAMADTLKGLGLTVFLDECELVMGRSLRGQIDRALLDSRFGLLILSPPFLAKRWPREEFEALFTLEGSGKTELLPVWLGVNHAQIEAFSPILASRLALQADLDPTVTAKKIVDHVEKIYWEEGSWAQLVRVQTLCLPWVQRPTFLPESLKLLDDHFPSFWRYWQTETELPTMDKAPTLREHYLFLRELRRFFAI